MSLTEDQGQCPLEAIQLQLALSLWQILQPFLHQVGPRAFYKAVDYMRERVIHCDDEQQHELFAVHMHSLLRV